MRLSLLAALLVVIRDEAAAATPWRTRLNVPGWNDVDSVFRRFDRDGSGDMSVSELRRALNQLGLRHDTREAARVLARFDLDENGSLSKPRVQSAGLGGARRHAAAWAARLACSAGSRGTQQRGAQADWFGSARRG